MPPTEQADFNGCGCLLLGPLALIFVLVRGFSGAGADRRRLTGLMTAFVMGADRSRAGVDEMHRILMNRFSHDAAYADLTTAVASFVPGGTAPFYDEARLAEEFRVFLRDRKMFVPDAPQEWAGVWPPPPSIDARYEGNGKEKK